VVIRSSVLEVEVLPEVGGKIGRIGDLRSSRSLLVPPQRPYRTIPAGDRWIDYDTSGMDDCFPNIDEGPYPREPWTGVRLPQLGEWVYGSWRVASSDERGATLERRGGVLPYRASKRIGFAAEDTLLLRYRVENHGQAPFQYLWAAHPLIAAGNEFELRLPAGALAFVTFPPDGRQHHWPRYDAIEVSREWIPHGTALKIFVTGLAEGWSELRFPTHALRFTFDVARTPVLGVWFNNFGFPPRREPFRCIAVEPCTSPSDLLHALEPVAYPVIEPASAAEWWMTIQVQSRV
jgi:hypothetical protein